MLAKEIRMYNQEQSNHLAYGGEETKNPEAHLKFRFHKT